MSFWIWRKTFVFIHHSGLRLLPSVRRAPHSETSGPSRCENNHVLFQKQFFSVLQTRTPEVYLPSRLKRFVEQNSNKNRPKNSATTKSVFTASLKLPSSPRSGANDLSGAQKLKLVCASLSLHQRHFYASLSVWDTSQHKHSCVVDVQWEREFSFQCH